MLICITCSYIFFTIYQLLYILIYRKLIERNLKFPEYVFLDLISKFYIKYELNKLENYQQIKLLIKERGHLMKYNYHNKINDMHRLEEMPIRKLNSLFYNIGWFQNLGSQFIYVIWNWNMMIILLI